MKIGGFEDQGSPYPLMDRDGNKTLTHLQPAKPAPFKTQMGGESGF